MTYVLDTHVWIWWHLKPDELTARTRRLLAKPEAYDSLLLSAISTWEFCKLVEKGRLALSCSPADWMEVALSMTGLELVPLTPVIAYASTTLPGEFHADPADQIIAATALQENATLITADQRLQDYAHVKTRW